MADNKCDFRYCNATVADYNEALNILKCPCMKCFGEKCETCAILIRSANMQMDLQHQMCSRCKFHNGR